MTLALKKEQKKFIVSMVHTGRFHNESEVVSEALRRMADAESDYLAPPPLTPAEVERIYGINESEEQREGDFGRAAFGSVRRVARRGERA